MNLADIRQDYKMASLNESEVGHDPISLFEQWMKEAVAAQMPDPTAMTLSTVNTEGKPSARVVLLKGLKEGKFAFYTNYQSRKGQELAQNPHACLTFLWIELERQVRIEGTVTKLSRERSADYFHSRPKGSQIGAHVSPQSEEIPNREFLESRKQELEARFQHTEQVALPEDWGGYELTPSRIEFWQGRPSRLHDRILFEQSADGQSWEIKRLAP